MSFILDDIDILRDMGYDVTVAADNRFGEDIIRGEIARRGAEFVDIRMDTKSPLNKANLECLRQYRALIRSKRFKAIVCHTPIAGLIVRMAAAGTGAKVIYVSHGLSWTDLSPAKTKLKFKSVEAVGSLFCDAIVTINTADFEEARKLLCRKVFTISGVGCDIERYSRSAIDRREMRRSLGISPDKILVLAIGEISERKNHLVIVRALASLPAEQRDRFVFVVAGRHIAGQEVKATIEREARDGGVDIRFLGFRSDIPDLVNCADIGVMPSVREGLGMAGIQMLAASVPLVGTSVQGIKEYIINESTGYTVASPFDAAGFAEALVRLSDVAVRRSMADACHAKAREFTKEKSIAQRRAIFTEIFSD